MAVLTDLVPQSQDLGSFVTGLAFEALREERWADVTMLASTLLDAQPPDHELHELRINRWMALRKLGEDITAETRSWKAPDDSRVVLGLAALLCHERETLDALRRCEQEGDDMRRLAAWPLLVDFGRSSHRVQQAVLRYQTSATTSAPRRRRHRKRR